MCSATTFLISAIAFGIFSLQPKPMKTWNNVVPWSKKIHPDSTIPTISSTFRPSSSDHLKEVRRKIFSPHRPIASGLVLYLHKRYINSEGLYDANFRSPRHLRKPAGLNTLEGWPAGFKPKLGLGNQRVSRVSFI